MRAICSYFKMKEIIYAEKVMTEVEPTLSVALEKDFWCIQNYKDVSGYRIITGMHQISVNGLQPLVYFPSFCHLKGLETVFLVIIMS